ncbi:hypothetical protein RHMOL_Rhmol05G0144300 [Rhododendron molle]|uniref:Uncharacterized protein n=1 Tax=Rhododendron molle TaxID=49168 RepID=A0ACC0NQ76_RHOML|nr:hypothetical protein RHMOL_Rhmol05G0144300 [Rhododendron molle]
MSVQASANFETFFESSLAIEDALQSGILSKGESSNLPKSKPRAYSRNTNALFGGGTYSNTTTSGTNATSANTTNHIADINQQDILSSTYINPNSAIFNPTDHIIPVNQPRSVVPLPLKPGAEVSYIHLEEGQSSNGNAPSGRLQNGAFVFNASISGLFHQSIPAMQLNSASSIDSPYFNITDTDPSPSLLDWFQSDMPLLEVDMQAVGWAMAGNMDYATPTINEWVGFELDGFPQQPKYLPFDRAWYDGWMAGHEAAILNPLDGISLYMLFHQGIMFPLLARLLTQFVMLVITPVLTLLMRNSLIPMFLIPVTGIAVSWSWTLSHHPIFGTSMRLSTFKLVAEVWAVNRSLAKGGLWDFPFITDPEPIMEVATVKDLGFWDSLLFYFVREVGNTAHTRQAELFIDAETGELLLGFEVFVDDTWSSSDEEPTKAEIKRKLNQPKVKTD